MNFIFYFHSFKRLIESRLIRYFICNVTHFRLIKTEISVNNRNADDENVFESSDQCNEVQKKNCIQNQTKKTCDKLKRESLVQIFQKRLNRF